MRPSPAITRYLQAQAQAMLPNQVRCAHGDHLVSYDDWISTGIMSRNGKQVQYDGCIACLSQKLSAAPLSPATPSGLSLHTQVTLRQARTVITQPASETEIEAAVQAIDAELKG